MKLKKAAIVTDVHFGRKSNSEQHNQDCINFISWFCTQVRNDPEIDHICFLGDWHENRSALNISTLKYSFAGAKLLSELNMPVFFTIGNHDLYYRHTRDIHSLLHFETLPNFVLIEEPYVCEDTYKPSLFCPYMFHHEYPSLNQYGGVPIWFGHFEFQGFLISGFNSVMQTGPNSNDFKGPKHIFSGHFHKRQAYENVFYVGNAFPMDFSDAGDTARGMVTYDYVNDHIEMIDWDDCPKYIKTTMTALVNGTVELFSGARVKCITDATATYEEVNTIRQIYTEKFNLRELTIEDSDDIENVLHGDDMELYEEDEMLSINELMLQLLSTIETDQIDTDMLMEIYKSLKV